MTPDERDRLRTVEVEIKNFRELLAPIAKDVADIKAAAHMGKGAWILLLKLGGVVTALAVAISWVWDHLAGKHP
jgi:hypothetical protein